MTFSHDEPCSEVSVVYLTETRKALLVTDSEDLEDCREIWLPKSLIAVNGGTANVQRGTVIELEAPDWLLEREGLA